MSVYLIGLADFAPTIHKSDLRNIILLIYLKKLYNLIFKINFISLSISKKTLLKPF